MSRQAEALLGGKAFSRGSAAPMLNPVYGGQMGFGPDLREWVNNAAYVQRHMFPILMEAPRFFNRFDDGQVWTNILRAMIELHPRSIEGLQMGLTAEFDETPVGGAGEMQEEVIDMKRERSTPTFVWHEKYGRPFFKFLEYWMTYGMMDPASKVANIGTMANNRPDDMLPDQYAMTVLFIEPDPLHRKVMKSWLCTNMMPKATGESTGRRDLTTAMSLQEMSIEFTALTQVGLGVDTMAQKILDTINISNANPQMRAAFLQEISKDVAAAPKGYQPQVSEFGQTAIQPS